MTHAASFFASGAGNWARSYAVAPDRMAIPPNRSRRDWSNPLAVVAGELRLLLIQYN